MEPTFLLVIAAAAFAMSISWLSLFPIRKFARTLGLLDRPGGNSSHAAPTPLGGGVGIFIGILVTVTLASLAALPLASVSGEQQGVTLPVSGWFSWLPETWLQTAAVYAPGVNARMGAIWAIIAAGAVLTALGVWDDRRGLPVVLRLGVQFGVAFAVVEGLDIRLTAYLTSGWLTTLLSMLWIVAVINSFNMLDNMDTLSGGVAAIIAFSMAAVMMTTPDPGSDRPQLLVAALLCIVGGAILGFLIHNRPPARIFMGDGGSYLVGFLISVAMLMATYAGGNGDEGPRPHAVLAPLCAMVVPLYDMTTVLWIRIREGRSPFLGDHSHLSHRLVDMGLSRVAAVATVHLITLTCGLSALLLTHVTVLQALTVLGIVGCMITLIAILESTQWRG